MIKRFKDSPYWFSDEGYVYNETNGRYYKDRYSMVLSWEGQIEHVAIGRVVYELFVGKDELDGKVMLFKDGDRNNFNLSNLTLIDEDRKSGRSIKEDVLLKNTATEEVVTVSFIRELATLGIPPKAFSWMKDGIIDRYKTWVLI